MASGEGTSEIVIGLILTVVGFGSILLDAPIYCCGFAIFGPILFIVGLSKALRAPPQPTYYPQYVPPPYYAPPPGAPPDLSQPPGTSGQPAVTGPLLPAAPEAPRKKCGTCGSDNRGDAKFCTSCGAPF